jgi:hypothetical protein
MERLLPRKASVCEELVESWLGIHSFLEILVSP